MRNTRQAFQKGFVVGSLLAGPSIMSKGKVPPGRQAWHRDDAEPMFIGDTASAIRSPTASTSSTSSRRCTCRATRRATTPPTTSASARTCRARSPRRGCGCVRPACTRSPTTRRRHGPVDVIVNYTNCVQCGAITAKGGRLTPPEGGDGPLYTLT